MVYQWRELLDNFTNKNGGDARVIMTESYSDINKIFLYYGNADGSKLGAHFTFNFNLITDLNFNSTAANVVDSIKKWLDNIPEKFTSNWVLGNHDNHRVATKFGPENVDGFNMLKSMLPGVAVTYNGEEIGQEDGEVSYEEGQDPSARDPSIFDTVSRDFERTPYQWDDSVNAGFNIGAKPWLPVSKKFKETNLASQKNNKNNSHYKIYQQLEKFRASPMLISGDVEVKSVDNVLIVKRNEKNSSLILLFNRSDKDVVIDLSGEVSSPNRIEIASFKSSKELG